MKNTVDIDILREKILLSENKIWGLLSFKAKIGKTFIAKHLVEQISKIGKSVVLISFSEEEAEKDKMFLENELKNVSEKTENIKFVGMNQLTNMEKIVYSEEFEKLLKQYEEEYDFVILDMLSFEESSIAYKIASFCEDNFIVLSKNMESGDDVQKKVLELKKLNIPLAGIVLNEYQKKKSWIRM